MKESGYPIRKVLVCTFIAVILWHLAPYNDVLPKAWHIFSIFIVVILSLILRPFPMGMSVLIGLVVLVITDTITIKESLAGYANSTVWLIVIAFLLAGAVINTGLGMRIAYWLVAKLGKSIKGIAYSICTSEFLLGSVMPSNTARGGGIHAPIVDSLSRSLGSTPDKDPDNAGAYLTLVGSHANLIAAAMFMTGMAANPLVTEAVRETYGIEFGWGTWLLGSIVPGLIALLLLPHFIFLLSRPKITNNAAAQAMAKEKLQEMGPMTRNERVMMWVLLGMLILWCTTFFHGLATTSVALLALVTLLVFRAQSWDDIIKNESAWDALIWLGGIITMATLMLEYGFIEWFVDLLSVLVSNLSGATVIIVLGVIYFYSMYGFSMLTAHIVAMAVPFLAVCAAVSDYGFLAAAIFAYFSCLCGCTTNYSSGPVIIYFGLSYVEAPKWFSIGFFVSLFHLTIWLGVGLVWWKILGWW